MTDSKKREVMTTTAIKKPVEFTKVSQDVYGNPRYVCHFLNFINAGDEIKANHSNSDIFGINTQYEIALRKSRELGGRKFHNKQYGGGIVFQSYNTNALSDRIREIQQVNTDFVKEFSRSDFRKVERAIFKHFTTHTYQFLETHGQPLKPFKPLLMEQIETTLGLAYTSSSDYAALWVCNSGYLMADETHHFIGFTINALGEVVAITQDEEENEIYITL